jgi:hypothetical protein
VNGAVPTTIIVAGLALAGYALLMTALNRRMNVPLQADVRGIRDSPGRNGCRGRAGVRRPGVSARAISLAAR